MTRGLRRVDRVALHLATAAVLAGGCQSGPRECWGDCALPPEAVMQIRDDRGVYVEVHDGDPAELTLPVQGGHILFVTARIKNLEKHGVILLGEVRNPDTGVAVARDEKRVDFSVALADGYGEPDLADTSNAANIAVCPNYLARDIVGLEWVVDLTLTDSRKVPVKLSHRVVPSCRQTDSAMRTGCLCECLGCFALGKCAAGAQPVGCDGG
jgi:hypothetical protein